MTTDYYDLDDILADSEKLTCKFNITVPGLGYLEGNPGNLFMKIPNSSCHIGYREYWLQWPSTKIQISIS